MLSYQDLSTHWICIPVSPLNVRKISFDCCVFLNCMPVTFKKILIFSIHTVVFWHVKASYDFSSFSHFPIIERKKSCSFFLFFLRDLRNPDKNKQIVMSGIAVLIWWDLICDCKQWKSSPISWGTNLCRPFFRAAFRLWKRNSVRLIWTEDIFE